jgi:hypothetical protein
MRASSRIAGNAQAKAESARDWLEKGWIRVTDIPRLGKGLVATRALPLAAHLVTDYQRGKRTNQLLEQLPIVGSIEPARMMTPAQAESSDVETARYLITVDETRAFDLATHWSGRINHGPPSKANICLDGVLIRQIRPIQPGEQLLYEYGLGYWIYQVSHRDVKEFTKDQRRVWKRVYLLTDDYSELMQKQLWEWTHPMDVVSELEEHLLATLTQQRARVHH